MVITDFKTGWTRYRPTDKAQLPLYALLVAEERGLDTVTARLWFLPYKRGPSRKRSSTGGGGGRRGSRAPAREGLGSRSGCRQSSRRCRRPGEGRRRGVQQLAPGLMDL